MASYKLHEVQLTRREEGLRLFVTYQCKHFNIIDDNNDDNDDDNNDIYRVCDR